MKNLFFIPVLAIICFLFGNPVMAQIYKYETESGQVFYTNDYNQIPKEYRDQVTDSNEVYARNPANTDEDAQAQTSNAGYDMNAERAKIEADRNELNQLHTSLTQKQKELEAQRAALPANDNEALENYNKEIRALNDEISDYTKRSEAYEESVRAFNSKVDELNTKK